MADPASPASPAAEPPASGVGPARDGLYIRRVIVAVGITLLALALALLLWYGVRVLMVAFAGVLLAVLLRSLAMGVHRLTGMPPGWALGVTLVLLIGLFVGIVWLMAPSVTAQANEMREKLPAAVDRMKERLAATAWGGQALKFIGSVMPGSGQSPPTQDIKRMTGVTLWALLDFLIILFLGIYLAAQPKLYVDGLAMLFPPSKRARICQVLFHLGDALQRWLIAQGIDMVVIGAMTWLGLWFLGVPLALALGLLAALFNFIPNFGPLFSYVPAVLLALTDSPEKALYVTILYIVLQNIEGYLLLPLLQRGAVDTPPALLIAGQVLLTLLVGGIGLALAAPLTACALIVVKMLYLHDVLGDPVELPSKTEPARVGGPAL